MKNGLGTTLLISCPERLGTRLVWPSAALHNSSLRHLDKMCNVIEVAVKLAVHKL